MKEEPLLRVAIQASYSKKPVLHDVSFDLYAGEILGLVGTSGAGKSTIVHSILGLLPWKGGHVEGEVLLQDRDLLKESKKEMRLIRGQKIALVPQSPMTALNSALTIQAHFQEAWRAHKDRDSRLLDRRVKSLFEDVQLPSDAEFLRKRPAQISVGQAQRVLIALALLHSPQLIIADEPTSALDPVTQVQILELLRTVNQKHGTSILYISHDLVSVLRFCDRFAVLDAGRIVETIDVKQVQDARHPKTTAFLGTLPVPPEVLLGFR